MLDAGVEPTLDESTVSQDAAREQASVSREIVAVVFVSREIVTVACVSREIVTVVCVSREIVTIVCVSREIVNAHIGAA